MAAENANNGVNETVGIPLITNHDNVMSDEEGIRDIHVVSEELIVAPEMVAEVTAEGEEEEEEEVPEESLLEVLYDQNVEFQNRIHELEEQAEERQAVVEQKDATIQACVTRYVMLEQKHSLAEYKMIKMESELKEEKTERVRISDAWAKAVRHVDIVERDVRSKKAKIDDMYFSFWRVIGSTQHRVLNYPVHSGQPEFDMDRRLMIQIMNEEYGEAVEGGICPIEKYIPTVVMTPNAAPDKSKPSSSRDSGCHDFPTSEEPK